MADEIKLNDDENVVEKEEVISELKDEAPSEDTQITSAPRGHSRSTAWMGALAAAYENPYEDYTNLSDIRKDNPELNQEMRKQLTHDIAYMGGGENAFINHIEAPKWDAEYPTVLTPEEAHSLSKELGHELKFEKDVTEGNVRFSVDQHLRKTAMQKALADYQATGSHGLLQDMALLGSAISGSFGGVEAVGTVAASALLYPVVGAAAAAGVTGLAKVPGMVNMAKGVRLAQKAIALEKKAQLATNNAITASRLLGKAGKYADLAKRRGVAARVAYDSLRYTQNATGKAASLVSTMVPFAIDGALSEVPREILLLQNAELTHDEEFTTSDAIRELLFAGTFAGALPVVGRVFKTAGSIASRAWNKVADKHAEEALRKSALARMKGHEGEAKAFEEAGNQVNKTIQEVSNMVRDPLPSSVEQAVHANEALNLSESEKSDVISFIIQTIERGGNIANIDALPHKGKLLSHVPYLRKLLSESTNLTASEIIEELEKIGIKVEKNLGKSQTGAVFEDAVRSGKMISTKLSDDSGILGQHAAYGFSLKHATEFLMDIYKYHMMDDLAAGDRAHAYIKRMEDAWFRLSYILEKYNYYMEVNKTKDSLTPVELLDVDGNPIHNNYGRVTIATPQYQLYKLANGKVGKLTDALNELFDTLLTEEEVQLVRLGQYLEKNPTATQGYSPRQIQEAQKAATQRKEMLDSVMQINEKGYIDLIGRDITGELEGKAETSFLGRLANSLSEGIEENIRLFETDKVLQKEFEGKADELWYKANIGDSELDETLGMAPSKQTLEDLKTTSETVDGAAQRRSKSVEEYTRFVDDARNAEVVNVFNELVTKMVTTFKEGDRQVASYFNECTQIIARTADALKDNFRGLRQEMLSAIEETDFFKGMRADIEQLYAKIDEIRTASGIEDGVVPELEILERELQDKLSGYARIIRSNDNPIRLQFVGRLLNPIKGAAGTDVLTERNIQKIVREASQALADKMENDLYFIEQLIGKAATEEGEQATTGVDALLDEAFKPAFEKMAIIMMDAQNSAVRDQLRLMKDFKDLYEAPALAKELLYAKSTFTPVNKEGTALSIENLSDITGVYRRFRASVAQRTSSTELQNGDSLLSYMDNVENSEEIINALYYISKYTPAELTEKGIKLNDRAARVAEVFKEYMAEEGLNLYAVGSNKTGKVSFLQKKAMAIASYVLPENAAPKAVNNLTQVAYRLSGETQAYVQRFFSGNTIEGVGDSFVSASRKKAQAKQDQANANFARVLFAYTDLDAHFNPDESLKVSLNEIRDAIMNGTTTDIPDKELEKGLRLISDGIFGNQKKSGLIQKIQAGMRNAQDSFACNTSRYVDDIEDMVHFKDDESAIEMMKLLGYDDINKLMQDNFTGMRKARAVIQNVGTKPIVYMEDLMGLYGEYISSTKALHRLGKVAHDDLKLSHLEKQRILTNLRTVTGMANTPAGFGARLCKIISQFIGSPMLVKAGLKSVSDYYYQHQYLVTAGLRSGMDVRMWADTVKRFTHMMESRELARHLLLNVGLKQDTILRAVTNSDTLLDLKTVKEIFGGHPKNYNKKTFNKYTPEILKWEQRADAWADFYINKVGLVGPMTEYNQSNAALSIMEGLGSAGNLRYADMNVRLQKTLLRHGISQYEWDNILSKQCIMSADAYSQKMYGAGSPHLIDHNMFFADLIAEMDDNTIRHHIATQRAVEAEEEVQYVLKQERARVQKEYEAQKAKGVKVGDKPAPVTEETIGAKHIRARYAAEITADDIRNYRETLLDKASILVNIGANEMTSLPNTRIQNMLTGYFTEPDTKWGIAAAAATKFQSFGMAVTQIQFGRRLATYADEARDNYLFRSVLDSAFATPGAASAATQDMVGFLVGCTITNAIINEILGSLSGRRKGWTDEEGKLNVDKIGAAFSQSIGILGPVYDGIMSAFEQRGKGGGITFSAFPVPSAVIRAGSNITTALTRESTEGQRGKALAGAMIQNFGDMTGLSRHVATQAAWVWMIGDRAKRWSMGDKAYRQYVRRLERAGFHNLPSLEFTN